MGRILDISGQKFGRLKVLKFDGVKNSRSYWICQCDCGNIVSVQGKRLKSGHTRSCGCLVRENSVKNLSKITKNGRETHGKRYTRLYNIWCDIKKRCNNENYIRYKDYGGRGISVCPEWENDFETFYKWSIENGYKDNLSIERIDVNGNYEPSNCKWIEPKLQSRNKRNSIIVEIDGKIYNLGELAEITGIKYETLKSRYYAGKRGKALISKEHGNKRAN